MLIRTLASRVSRPLRHGTYSLCTSSSGSRVEAEPDWALEEWPGFDLPTSQACMPPNSWYTSKWMYELEVATTFKSNWIPVARLDQFAEPLSYVSGLLFNKPYFIIRDNDEQGTLRAFYNVCRHRAARLLTDVSGTLPTACVKCPYHGWEYRPDGRLAKAPRLGGAGNFRTKDYGLIALGGVRTWGPLVFIRLGQGLDGDAEDLRLARLYKLLAERGFDNASMRYIGSRTYDVACNWKVFVDNYLDGGYHVSLLHKDLAASLDLDQYKTEVAESYSVQSCQGRAGESRLEGSAIYGMYAFVHPNLMINRYGPWLDTNVVYPVDEHRSRVQFDYWLDSAHQGDSNFVNSSLEASDKVQREDIEICENVQVGLFSGAYQPGRYAPKLELGDHAFHKQLYREYILHRKS